MTVLIILPENSVFDCQRNGTSLYYVPNGDDTVRWFFLDKDADVIRWSDDVNEITNFIGNCVIDEIITEEKAIDDFWSGLGQAKRIELIKLATNLPEPSAVAMWRTPPQAVREYLEKNPDTIRKIKREDL